MDKQHEMGCRQDRSQVGAAILGLFGAIKICRREGYDAVELLRLVERQTEAWGLLPDKQRKGINEKEA